MITATVLGLYWLSTFIKSALSFSQHQCTINQVANFPKLAVWRCLFVQNSHTAHPQTNLPASSEDAAPRTIWQRETHHKKNQQNQS